MFILRVNLIDGLVTARPASKRERNFYQELAMYRGGEDNGKNKKS